MKHIDFEKTMRIQAARGLYGRPLRDEAYCLICRWWRKPCPACLATQNGRQGKGNGTPTDLDALLRREFNRMAQTARQGWRNRLLTDLSSPCEAAKTRANHHRPTHAA